MIRFLKHLYNNTAVGHRFLTPIRKINNYCRPRLLSEKMYIRRTFKNVFGYELDLNNPKTFSEKILWLQQYDRTQLHTSCADKYAVRNHIKKKIGEKYLIPLVFHTKNPDDLVPNNLPDYPFIIKTNHGCGGHIIVKEKSKVNWNVLQKHFKNLLKRNFYYRTREWQYKNIKPCILVEKLLLDNNFKVPYDYKFNCFNGAVAFIGVIKDRFEKLNLKIYDPDWNSINCQCTIPGGDDVEKPFLFDEMKKLAEIIAQDFKYVRIDLYYLADKIYFGEMTFSPEAGFEPYGTEYDIKFGEKLKL